MNKIGVDYAVMQENGDEILRQNDVISEAIQSVISAVDKATSNWEGKSQSSYLERFESLKPVITTQLYECLSGLGNELKDVKESFKNLDEFMASRIKF